MSQRENNNPGGVRTWTPARDADLQRLWALGWTASKVAARLCITRNAVIGRVHRLGLAKRPNPVKRHDGLPVRRSRPRNPTQPLKAPAPSALPAAAKPIGKPVQRAVDALRTCQWLTGEPRQRAFCAEPCREGSPYCPEHHERCYQKPAAA